MEMRFSLTVRGSTVEFQGSPDIFDSKIKPWCDRLFALPKSADKEEAEPASGANPPRPTRGGTVNTVIAKLGADSCMDVLKAAAAQIVVFQGKDRFTDDEWDQVAKTANAWKAKYSNEKAKTKKRLIGGGFVIENAAGVFSLADSSLRELEAKLGQ